MAGVSAKKPGGEVDIYALVDPRDNSVRYVGKANNAAARLKTHLRDANLRHTPVYCWIRKLRAEGVAPDIKVLESVHCDEWAQAEVRWIAEMRQSCDLLNVANGGNEPPAGKSGSKPGSRNRVLWELKLRMGILLKDGLVRESTKQKLRMLADHKPEWFAEYAFI